jgi:hypothetical protein
MRHSTERVEVTFVDATKAAGDAVRATAGVCLRDLTFTASTLTTPILTT